MTETLDYNDLSSFSKGELDDEGSRRLLGQIERAYGAGGLGILTIAGVPGFVEKRRKLLVLAQKVAQLPKASLDKITDVESNYQNGWSHGIEVLENGTPDILKGSFYANPNFNDPLKVLKERNLATDQTSPEKFKIYTRPNVWPKDIPELETALLSLGNQITDVGILLAKACDAFVRSKDPNLQKDYKDLSEMISESVCNKARLLHYFPSGSVKTEVDEEKWCGVHCDHSLLTGLCRAIFLTKDGKEAKNLDPNAGLYIELPNGDRKKIVIPEDHMGFQIGHSAQIVSNNFLRATPHLVRAPSRKIKEMEAISRNTFAVFLQPHWEQKFISRTKPAELLDGLSSREFESGMTFGEFSERMVEFYHRNMSKL